MSKNCRLGCVKCAGSTVRMHKRARKRWVTLHPWEVPRRRMYGKIELPTPLKLKPLGLQRPDPSKPLKRTMGPPQRARGI